MEHDQLAMDIAWHLHANRQAGNDSTVKNLLKVRYNLEFLGSGNFSSVMQHPYKADRVIKIMSPERLGDGGTNYLLDDPYLGYILWCREQTDPLFPKVFDVIMHDRAAVIVLEKLSPIEGDAYWAAYRKYFSAGARPDVVNYMTDVLGQWDDIHENNVMVRANGDVVLTDPYAYRGPTDRRYEDYVKVDGRITMQVKHGAMARNRQSFADWRQHKDAVLRARQDTDSVKNDQGVPGALLQRFITFKLRTFRRPELERGRRAEVKAHHFGRAVDIIVADTITAGQPRSRPVERLANFVKDVALACVDRPINKLLILDHVQPERRQGDRPDLRVLKHREPGEHFRLLADPMFMQKIDIDDLRQVGWFRVEDRRPECATEVPRKDVA